MEEKEELKQETANEPEKEVKEPEKEAEEESDDKYIEKLSEKKAKKVLKQYITDFKELQAENSKIKAELEETKNDYLRARADCENVRKRKAEEVRVAYADGKTEAVTKILSVGDSLDWALKMELDEKTREGIEKLVKKYHEILESLGVKEFSPEEKTPFDPNTAAAVMQVDGEEGEESGTVKQIFGRGYKLGDKVIRYAQVSVIK